jgi:hypothetical protein
MGKSMTKSSGLCLSFKNEGETFTTDSMIAVDGGIRHDPILYVTRDHSRAFLIAVVVGVATSVKQLQGAQLRKLAGALSDPFLRAVAGFGSSGKIHQFNA